MSISVQELYSGIESGNKRLLAKAITLVESKKPEHRILAEELLEKLIPLTGKSIRIAVSGVPGAGKSTFIENFGKLAISHGKKVAVLAIDPSSSINKGSILGDKTRMDELSKEENAFIRPTPNSGFLGGVANTTFETMLICEAAGFDYILIETVGVGQSETLVADISDVFLFLKITGGGDELQGIKRGIMEIADLIFINKVDGANLENAKKTRQELLRAMHFFPQKISGYKTPVLLGSALENNGLQEVYDEINHFIQIRKKDHSFYINRDLQSQKRFDYWINELILQKMGMKDDRQNTYLQYKQKVSVEKSNPASEARKFVNELFGNR